VPVEGTSLKDIGLD